MRLVKETEEWISYPNKLDEPEFQEENIAGKLNLAEYSGMFSCIRRRYSEKEYKNGLLIREYWLDDGMRSFDDPGDLNDLIEKERIIKYDNQNRITFETESYLYAESFDRKEVFHTSYQYNNESWIKTRIKKYSGFFPVDDIDFQPGDRFREVDEIDSIYEVNVVNGFIQWEKLTNISQENFQLTKYVYDNDINSWEYGMLEKIVGPHKIDKYNCILSEFYPNVQIHYIDPDIICLKITYDGSEVKERLELINNGSAKKKNYKKTTYKNGLMQEIYHINSENLEDPAYIEKYEYDLLDNLICINFYSQSNGVWLLYKKQLFEYREINKSESDTGKIFLLIRSTTKVHYSIYNSETDLLGNEKHHIKFYPVDTEDHFIVTDTFYKIYNSENKIVEEREFHNKILKKIVNYRYDSQLNCVNKESMEIYNPEQIKYPEYDIFNYDEFNNLKFHVHLFISNEGISTQTIKHYYYETL